MTKQIDYICARFHKVDAWTWLRVRQLLNGFLLNRLVAGSQKFFVVLCDEDFETIRDFCEQMDMGYLHPRRDAAHIKLCQTMYGTMNVPAKALERIRKANIARFSEEKKPKSNQ